MSIPFRRPHGTPSSGGRVADIEPSARTKAAWFRAGQGSPKSIGVDSDRVYIYIYIVYIYICIYAYIHKPQAIPGMAKFNLGPLGHAFRVLFNSPRSWPQDMYRSHQTGTIQQHQKTIKTRCISILGIRVSIFRGVP